MAAETRYVAPNRFDPILNGLFRRLSKWGISVAGSCLLAVRGRTSGEWRTTPVNVLTAEDGQRYLVAPRGHTQWVRNLRVAGTGELRRGRKVEAFTAVEVPDADKVPLLRLYLQRWGWEVGRFFEGVTKDATDDELAAIAPGFPVFRIS
ncbi:nitroreductase family deazaflavin-dependent oxidoreductase [Nocardia paucivorans]|uniref:nitroreductase family deazaflavin-dependent oxidoreductase n=1 Tax=Nocardia paucivorans TaxID=114259 RepID=UPI000314CC06|nr:nitroreductase family deazaflavin-dependent oxidoreductase [Nocardia paucivorans]